MRLRVSTLLLVVGLVAGQTSALGSTVPQLIPYSGSLTGPNGQPLPTGDYTLTFRIYNDPKSTNVRPVWGPQIFDGQTKPGHGAKVPVVKGHFSAILGPYDVNGAPIAKAFRSSDRYIEVTLDGDDPNLPRHRVLSTPFALSSIGETPVGGIIMWSGRESELPENWRVCRGQGIADPSSPLYGKRLPNLRNLFVRGAAGDLQVLKKAGENYSNHRHSFNVRRDTSTKISSYESNEYVVPKNSLGRKGFWLYEGFNMNKKRYRVEKTHEALGVDHNGRSHSHYIHHTGTASHALVFNIPQHINLYYIIRIK